ncbi:MAG TPA: TIM barrel protein, partial [Anaerolineaceae bacterium]|nr:TIM barrel protein [Anaerolineaceae bacterium]
ELAHQLGSRLVVIHPGRIPGDHSLDNRLRDLYRSGLKGTSEYDNLRQALTDDRRERSRPHLDALLRSLDEIVQFSQNSGLFLGLENRFHYYELPVFNEMQTLLDAFPQPWVGWQLDVGHIQVHDTLGLMNFQQWLDAFSSRIVGVHLHDVAGIVDHQVPGSGEVDFSHLAQFLPHHAYRTLEINSAVTFEEFTQGLLVLEKAGCITSI